jgi:A118 family predicted phage portal protein
VQVAANQTWPPKQFEIPARDIRRWAAWYSGSPELLTAAYGGGFTSTERSFEQQFITARGGLIGMARRLFWGTPNIPGQPQTKLHVPLAAQVATVSANLLFAQPPSITVADADTATQDRIDALLGETAHRQLHAAAESCAALGHVYLRVGWDYEIDPAAPLLSVVDADAAYPTYAYGRLREVTFVREFPEQNGVWRHVEQHAVGVITHALYLGTPSDTGHLVPLTEHPSCAGLVDAVDDQGQIHTQLTRLAVVGIPNAPTRTWRHIACAVDLGRADISGVEDALDKLDETWTSLIRDVRHGKSRIHVPQHMLDTNGPGRGARMDLDREVYVGLEAMASDGQMQIQSTQFQIRDQEHRRVIDALRREAVAGAGYSPQTFGLDTDAAITATESWARASYTRDTRAAKIRYWRPAVADLTQLMLEVDAVYFKGAGDPTIRPDVSFIETIAQSDLAKAQTVQAWRAAEAASTETIVAYIHPDYDDEQVQEEVERINGEKPAAPDPMSMFDNLNQPGQVPDDGSAGPPELPGSGEGPAA